MSLRLEDLNREKTRRQYASDLKAAAKEAPYIGTDLSLRSTWMPNRFLKNSLRDNVRYSGAVILDAADGARERAIGIARATVLGFNKDSPLTVAAVDLTMWLNEGEVSKNNYNPYVEVLTGLVDAVRDRLDCNGNLFIDAQNPAIYQAATIIRFTPVGERGIAIERSKITGGRVVSMMVEPRELHPSAF